MPKILQQISLILFIIFIFTSRAYCRSAEEWKTRSIYQVLIDRFAPSKAPYTKCKDLTKYCGGTIKGIIQNLDYIKNMGFNAIWISPIFQNLKNGYHGYWITDFYQVNPNFGSKKDVEDLIHQCHQRDIWVMFDIVINHVAPIKHDFSQINPFNKKEHYHKDCKIKNWDDQTQVENCRLFDLPDLAQENPEVKNILFSWITDLIKNYNIDGLRIDAVKHVPKTFWKEFNKVSGVFTIGEVMHSDLKYVAEYQGGPMDSVLDYSLFHVIRSIFLKQGQGTMLDLQKYFNFRSQKFQRVDVLGIFYSNHDNSRPYLYSLSEDSYKALITLTMSWEGIPIFYYGDEQGFKGGQKWDDNREPLWETNFDTNGLFYQFIQKVNLLRTSTEFYKEPQIERNVDFSFYSFTRGKLFFAFSSKKITLIRVIWDHNYEDSTVLCNALKENDCVEVEDGSFTIILINGEAKILSPTVNSNFNLIQGIRRILKQCAKRATMTKEVCRN